ADGHEPGVLGREEVGGIVLGVGGAVASERVAIDAGAVQVAHEERAAVLLGVGLGVVDAQPAVRGLLVLLGGDRRELVRQRRVRAALAVVVAALRHVEQVVDYAAGDE